MRGGPERRWSRRRPVDALVTVADRRHGAHVSRMSRRALLPFAALLAVAAWPSSAALQDADEVAAFRERFEGTWRLTVSQQRAQQTVNQAVDRAVDAMPFFFRPVARDRLREGTPVVRRIELDFRDDGRLSVSFDGRRYTTRIGRTERARRARDGEPMRVTQRLRDSGQLEQVFQTDSGTRWYVYTATGDDRMRVESTTNSDRMPQPLRFRLDYRRQ